MSAHEITLHLPETLYQRFRQRAEWTHRSLETEILDAVASAASVDIDLLPDFLKDLESLETLDDDTLWHLASSATPSEASERLAALHLKMRDEGLSREEDEARARLMQEYERSMLTRAQAAKLLKERGRDISKLLATP